MGYAVGAVLVALGMMVRLVGLSSAPIDLPALGLALVMAGVFMVALATP